MWESRFDQLDAYLDELRTSPREDDTMNDDTPDEVRIERTFDAPVDAVWRMWTVPEHYQRWYGPFGASIPVAEMDVRVGGARRVCMEVDTPDGPRRMWFAGQYRQVEEHRLLVYSESVVDETGQPLPGPSGHPTETEVQVELDDLGGQDPRRADPPWDPRRLARSHRLGHGTRRPRRGPHLGIAVVADAAWPLLEVSG